MREYSLSNNTDYLSQAWASLMVFFSKLICFIMFLSYIHLFLHINQVLKFAIIILLSQWMNGRFLWRICLDFFSQYRRNRSLCYDCVNTWEVCTFRPGWNDREILTTAIISSTITNDHNQGHINRWLLILGGCLLIIFLNVQSSHQQILPFEYQMAL